MIKLDTNVILTFLACICFLFIFGKLFIYPIKKIFKLVLNSSLGAVLIYIVNIIGGMWNFHIGLNIITAISIGLLGVPGAILLIVLKLLLG